MLKFCIQVKKKDFSSNIAQLSPMKVHLPVEHKEGSFTVSQTMRK